MIAKDIKKVYSAIKGKFEKAKLKGYKNSHTCLNFVFGEKEIDYRVKIYNKWINLLESESVSKLISMGTKALFFCSATMFDKHKDCINNGITRVEVTKKLHSTY
jgi:hypothetical protein